MTSCYLNWRHCDRVTRVYPLKLRLETLNMIFSMRNGQRKRASAATDRKTEAQAQVWGKTLARKVAAVLKEHPDADPDNVRHTLILLELPPLERLARSLLRGRALAKRK